MLKTTALVDTDSQAMLNVRCTTKKRQDTHLAILAANKVYDWMELREKIPEEGVRTLIKNREI
jgi:IS5 family transposase